MEFLSQHRLSSFLQKYITRHWVALMQYQSRVGNFRDMILGWKPFLGVLIILLPFLSVICQRIKYADYKLLYSLTYDKLYYKFAAFIRSLNFKWKNVV